MKAAGSFNFAHHSSLVLLPSSNGKPIGYCSTLAGTSLSRHKSDTTIGGNSLNRKPPDTRTARKPIIQDSCYFGALCSHRYEDSRPPSGYHYRYSIKIGVQQKQESNTSCLFDFGALLQQKQESQVHINTKKDSRPLSGNHYRTDITINRTPPQEPIQRPLQDR